MSTRMWRFVSRNPELVSRALVFTATRVPAQTLVDYLKAGHTLDDFLGGFRASAASRPAGRDLTGDGP